jgi:hypothetical protein
MQRVGELLKEIKPGKTGPKLSRGAPTEPVGRFAEAEKAGLSKDQAVTAIRVASIPPEEFEAAVESDKPPTVTELAEADRLGVAGHRVKVAHGAKLLARRGVGKPPLTFGRVAPISLLCLVESMG